VLLDLELHQLGHALDEPLIGIRIIIALISLLRQFLHNSSARKHHILNLFLAMISTEPQIRHKQAHRKFNQRNNHTAHRKEHHMINHHQRECRREVFLIAKQAQRSQGAEADGNDRNHTP
jgi:hypothetical protein